MQTKVRPQAGWSRDDYIIAQLQGLREDMREFKKDLNARMDGIEKRMDRIETGMDRIETGMDDIKSEMRSMFRHSQILTASVVGIALAVCYSVLR